MHILLACPSSLHCMQCSCTTHASLRDVMNACNELPQSSRHYERRAVTRRPVHAWITDGAWITVCLLRIRMPQASSLLIRAQAMQLPPACGAVLSCPLQSNVPPPPPAVGWHAPRAYAGPLPLPLSCALIPAT